MTTSAAITSSLPGKGRTILFLRGHPSRLWPQLADALCDQGYRVLKVHLSLADRVFWGRRGALSYTGGLSDWARWLDDLVAAEGVTDVLYHGEQQPYHLIARKVARRHGATPWVLEFGYFRPDWLTFEEEGVNAFSRFPKSPEAIRTLAQGQSAPKFEVLYPHGPVVEWAHEAAFHFLEELGRPFFPGFESDRPHGFFGQAPSWARDILSQPFGKFLARRLMAQLLRSGSGYNLLALQLQSDYQVRYGSPFPDPDGFLDHVLASFARSAPPDRLLVVKRHPLDLGIENWPARLKQIARNHGLSHRVKLIKGGDLNALLTHSKGAVVVNSTTGIRALQLGVPICVLGAAVYDIPGLSHQDGLDIFWTSPNPVDPDFLKTFLRAIARRQTQGSFYNRAGQKAAVRGISRLLADPLDGPGDRA